MVEAVRLVTEEGYSIAKAAKAINSAMKNGVPRITLNDHTIIDKPLSCQKASGAQPSCGEGYCQCLIMCSEFQYPMRKRDVQWLVQSNCIEHNAETRWPDAKPGKQGSIFQFE
jgi:hypothetical protein